VSEKWTAGPWRLRRSTPSEGVDVYWLLAGDSDLGSMCGGHPYHECRANAVLAAAAPELYRALDDARVALEEAARVLSRDSPSLANNIVNQCAIRCADALAKARGEP
jgi:hypothetical protein